ncbi:helix-turn-helix transcriptional regulator [Ruminococcus gauvreauii]|uniref:helix-turn-helix transcriptional regulator n=1 Tax=Ruminococcus gauvreauii TaxID=438033 RepID=UPI003984004F
MLKFRKDEQSEGSLIMKRVLEYISQNYDKQLKLEEAAEQVYITPAYLGIIFKKETGKNFTAYLTDLRMEKAKELLLDVRININEITYKVGYHNVRYFSRTFKEYVGITPKEYRKIHANRKY